MEERFELMCWGLILSLFRNLLIRSAKGAKMHERFFQTKILKYCYVQPQQGPQFVVFARILKSGSTSGADYV